MCVAEDGEGSKLIKAGTVLDDEGLIACGSGALRLMSVQPAGKSAMAASDFARGHGLLTGAVIA
jgi:methionyl-tRNA formyltransferase